jgi:FixJ family two-component response regulator
MNGQQLADELRSRMPGLPVVFMSAYTRGALTSDGDATTVTFLDKPFTAAALTEKIRTMLGGAQLLRAATATRNG